MSRATPRVQRTTIFNGTSDSTEIDIGEMTLVGIIIPAAWTAAALTFRVESEAGGTPVPLFDDSGAEVTIASANVVASHAIGVRGTQAAGDALRPWRWLTIRSGTNAAPVTQGADRVLILVLKN